MLLDAYFDYASPFAYLGMTQIERITNERGAKLSFRPFLLGGLFKAIGTANVPLFTMPDAKRRHQLLDLHRWAHHWGVPFRFPTRFPMTTVTALRMTLQLTGGVPSEACRAFVQAVFRAYWAEDRDIADQAELRAIAEACDLDGDNLLAGTQDAAIKDALRAATEEAALRGVCGVPTFVVRRDDADEGFLFWGQDRLELVDEALGGWRPRAG